MKRQHSSTSKPYAQVKKQATKAKTFTPQSYVNNGQGHRTVTPHIKGT